LSAEQLPFRETRTTPAVALNCATQIVAL
jgi:hypothetical protein